jgi:hypothetical protein
MVTKRLHSGDVKIDVMALLLLYVRDGELFRRTLEVRCGGSLSDWVQIVGRAIYCVSVSVVT